MSDIGKEECLFIGGPWNARRVEVNTECDTIRAPAIAGAAEIDATEAETQTKPDESVMYRRAKLFSPRREWPVFVSPDVGDVMGALIAGYGVALERQDGDI